MKRHESISSYEKLKLEGKEFRDTGFCELPKDAQAQVLTYMRGIKDGLELAKKHRTEAVAV